MRLFAIVLLVLAADAPAASDLTAAASCTLAQPDTDAAFRALPLLSEEDDTEADESGTISSFRPQGLTVWGTPLSRAQLFAYSNRTTGNISRRYQVRLTGDYADARAKLFAAHGRTRCNRETGDPGGRSCEIPPADAPAADGKWRRWTSLDEVEGQLMLTCDYAKQG